MSVHWFSIRIFCLKSEKNNFYLQKKMNTKSQEIRLSLQTTSVVLMCSNTSQSLAIEGSGVHINIDALDKSSAHLPLSRGCHLTIQAVDGRPPRYAPALTCKWWHDIRHVHIWICHHYCMSMLACQYNQPKRPGDLDILTLKVVSESRVTWATSVLILVLLGLSVLELRWMYATDRRHIDVRQKHRLMHLPIRGGA